MAAYDSAFTFQGLNILRIDPGTMTAELLSFDKLNVLTASLFFGFTKGNNGVLYGCPFTARLNLELTIS